jgi:hypothetical protein
MVMNDRELGLYDKYLVTPRKVDVSGKHSECFYFVLDTVHDPFAKQALMAYAMACRDDYPQLSDDLIELVLEGR